MKILVVIGHPRAGSFSDALALAFVEGATENGADVRLLVLRDLDYNPNVVDSYASPRTFEPDLESSRESIVWCDCIVFVYPTWWAGVPSLLKGFLDRVLTSGFAFEATTGGTGYRGLLEPRSAQIVTTMDTPWWVYRWIYGRPGELAMKRGTLGFCGFSPVRSMSLSPVKSSTPQVRSKWLQDARDAGRNAARGPTLFERSWKRTRVWLQAMRLQFYPMTFLAYSAGAIGACGETRTPWNWQPFAWGYLCLFCLEVATVFANDIYDLESDRKNPFYGPFSGGSRVLVEQRICLRSLSKAAIVVTTLAIAAGALALWHAPNQDLASIAVLLLVGLLAIGYTVPPLKLSHRGLGELDVCLTHSFGVILCGYLLQGGRWTDAFPWLLALPLCLAILPSILLAGIPDREADQTTGKRTLVVSLGDDRTIVLSAVCVVLSITFALVWATYGISRGAYAGLGWIAVPHGIWLLWCLSRLGGQLKQTRRIDGTIVVALMLVMWFAVAIVAQLLITTVET